MTRENTRREMCINIGWQDGVHYLENPHVHQNLMIPVLENVWKRCARFVVILQIGALIAQIHLCLRQQVLIQVGGAFMLQLG